MIGRKKVQKILKKPMLHQTFMDKNIKDHNPLFKDGDIRLEYPISKLYILILGFIFTLILIALLIRVGFLQVVKGEEYVYISENNTFAKVDVLPVRGSILDRNGVPLAWNKVVEDSKQLQRYYIGKGFSSLLGFIRYPQKDSFGNYFRIRTEGVSGLEEKYNDSLSGNEGSLVLEKRASGEIVSELYLEEAYPGKDVKSSIDVEVQKSLYNAVSKIAKERDFVAAAGVVLDINTGEIISLVSYPDYDNNILTNATKEEQTKYLNHRNVGEEINRAVSGLYLPGSTIKPFFAVAGLEEDVIKPSTTIVSNGFITIKNPYDPNIVYTYKDRAALGPLDLYGAISQSSNIYFYHIGGGYGHITNPLGIDRIENYSKIFGFGRNTKLKTFPEPIGVIPNPTWKEQQYNERWTVGDTYNTVIGQYDFQVTPLQLARATAAIANAGYFVEPHLEYGKRSTKVSLGFQDKNLKVIREAMRQVITEGTGGALVSDKYSLAGKTGTAQIGNKGLTNSLLIGFFPYNEPKYAFTIIMERGHQYGVLAAAKLFFDDIAEKDIIQLK